MATKKPQPAYLTDPAQDLNWDAAEAYLNQPAPEAAPSEGVLRRVGDVGISALKGAIGVPEAAVGIADLLSGGYAGKLAEEAGFRPKDAKDYLNTLYSKAQQEANQKVAAAQGFTPTVIAALQNPSFIVQNAIESAPSMLTGAAVSRGALALAPRMGAVMAGALGEGATAAGQNAEQVRQEDPNGTLTARQSAILAASGLTTAGIGFGAGRLANKLGIGDAATMLASGRMGPVGEQAIAEGAKKNLLRKISEGVAVEGIGQELPQSYQEQVAQNLAQGKSWDEGAAAAGAQGMLAGGLMGGVAGSLHAKHVADDIRAEKVPDAGPLSRAANAGIEQKALQIENNPDPLIAFPDGTVGKQSDIDTYISSLPEADQIAARAKLLGLGEQSASEVAPNIEQAAPLSLPGPDSVLPNGRMIVDGEGGITPETYGDARIAAENIARREELGAPIPRGQAVSTIPGDEDGANNPSKPEDTAGNVGNGSGQQSGNQEAVQGRNDSARDGILPGQNSVDGNASVDNALILNPQGQPFVTEFAAKRKLKAENLADTHEVTKVDGGFVVQRKPTPESAAKNSENIPFVRNGDFWNYSGDRVAEIAKTLGTTVTKRNGIPMVGIPHHALDSMSRELRDAGIEASFGDKAAEEKPQVERRKDIATRKAVDQMTPEEMRVALLTSSLTGIPNKRAFEEHVQAHPKDKVLYGDLDDFKSLNTKFGHEGADQILRAVGTVKAKIAEGMGVTPYHRSGDEFLAIHANDATLKEYGKSVQEALANATFQITMPDGTIAEQNGVGFSYGTDQNVKLAELRTGEQKAERKRLGLRTGQRDTVEAPERRGQDNQDNTSGRNGPAPVDGEVAPNREAPAITPDVKTEPSANQKSKALQERDAKIAERDSFAVERPINGGKDFKQETFTRGEYVEALLSVGAKSTSTKGVIDGVSQAKRQAKVNGQWFDFPLIQKTEVPLEIKPETVPLSKVLEKANEKSGAGLTEADRIMTLDGHDNAMEAARTGTISIEDFKDAYASTLANESALKAEMNGKTKDQLLRAGGPMFAYRHKTEKKGEIIDALYSGMVREFALGKEAGVTYSLGSGVNTYEKSMRASIDKAVQALTAEDLSAFSEEISAEREEATQARVARTEGMEDPKKLEDFHAIIREKKEGGMSFSDARMSMTPEQRARFDELTAEKSREERTSSKEEKRAEVSVADQVVSGDIIETKHTQKGHDLFVVQLSERVSREDYETLNTAAKKMGGYYSSFRGHGATPGFQFKDRDTASAFVKLAQGDKADAQEAVNARRDAFADDRSQTAVQRLTEMADAIEERASASLNQERKTNTARRARMASGAEAAARSERALGETMRNIAAAIESGKARFLDRVRQKVQVQLLNTLVNNAHSDAAREKAGADGRLQYEKLAQEPITASDADHATWPQYTAYRSDLASLGRQLSEVDGTKKLGQRMMKVADDVSDAYLAFAKENFQQVAIFKGKDGSRAAFSTRDDAEAAIARSGYRGKAIVFQVKRGENQIILSPSEAMARDIWKGDGDKKITLSPEFGAELVESIGKVNRRTNKVAVPWQFETAHERRKMLARMGIETPAEMRAALREFIGLREAPAEADKIQQMERAMIGRKNDGLDFFPTPAVAADEAIAAADIKEGMSVYEPQAGMGHIADRIREAGVEPDVGEISSDRRELLEAKGYNLVSRDFMEMRLEDTPDGKGYDRIIMNPPFSDRRDVQHVMHAYELLKPDGRLVAIMGEGSFFGQDKKAQAFRDWLESVNGTDEKLAEGTFMDPSLPVNTGVNARMVVIDKQESSEMLPNVGKEVERYAGQYDKGLSGFNARIEAKKRNRERPELTWHVEDAEAKFGGDRYEVVGREATTQKPVDKDAAFSRAAQTDTPAFKNWFGDSKVVDADGNPLVVYHGTASDFSIFDLTRSGEFGARFADAVFFTSDPVVAAGYSIRLDNSEEFVNALAEEREARDRLMKSAADGVHKSDMFLGNRARWDEIADRRRKMHSDINTFKSPTTGANIVPAFLSLQNPIEFDANGKLFSKANKQVIERALKEGRDGAIIRNVIDTATVESRGGSDVFVAFSPEQIKSATGNNGNFDPKNPDVRLDRSGRLSTGMTIKSTQAEVDRLTATWKNAPKTSVVQSVSDLPFPAPNDVRGAFHNGTVYLVADGLSSADDAQFVLFHEALGHAGLHGMLGDSMTKEMHALAMKNQGIREQAAKWRKANADIRGNQSDEQWKTLSIEETLADVAGAGKKINGIDRLLAAIQSGLRAIGLDAVANWMEGKTNAEVLRVLADAKQHIEQGESIFAAREAQMYARKDDAASSQNDNVLKALSENDSIFRLRKSSKDTVEGITADVDKTIEVKKLTGIPGETRYNFTLPDGRTARMMVRPWNKYGNSIYGFDLNDGEMSNMEDGRPGRNAEEADGKDDVWIDVSLLSEGGGYGAKIYAIAANYAHNTGKVFIGDPAGLSDEALIRRPEQMLSSALKFGTTEHLGPHPRQINGDKSLGVGPLDWVYGDDIGNIQKLIALNLANIENAGGNGGIQYDQSTGRFTDGSGSEITREDINGLARTGLGREAQAGGATLARAALLRSLVQGGSGSIQRPDGVLAALSEQLRQYGAATGTPLERIFYSRSNLAGSGGTEHIPQWAKDLAPEVQDALRKSGAIYEQKTLKQKITELKTGALKKMQYGVLDQFAPIKDQIGKIPYIMARMAKNADGTLEALMLYGRPYLDADGGMLADTSKKGFVEVMQGLNGEHDRFFSWMAGKRAAQLKAEGRENLFTNDDISSLSALSDGVMQDGSSRQAAYAKAQRDVAGLNASVLDIAEKSGLIDPESRKVWASDFYVPFYRIMEEGVTGPSIKSGLTNQKSIKQLKGGTNNLGDLTQNMLMNWSTLLTASAKNRAARATLDGATAIGAAIEADETTIRQMGKSINTKAVSYMEAGKNRWFVVDDPHLLAAVSALEFNGYNNSAMKVMATFKNYLTRAVTVSPLFKVRNLIRDSVTTVAVSDSGFNPLANVKKGYSLLRDDAFKADMIAGGGVFRFGAMMEGNRGAHVKNLIDAGVKDETILNTKEKMQGFLQKIWDSYQEAGDLSENVNRAALYNKLRSEGKTHLEASFEARDLLDFGLSGAWAGVRALNQVLPFFNARLQGIYKLGRGYHDDPKRMGYVVGAVALASVALMAAYKDDDDFKKRSESDRNNYWWFKVGSTAFRIPKPFEIGAMGSAIEHFTALFIDSENTDAKRFTHQMGDLITGQLAMNPIPQMFRPMIDVYANKDSFSGRAIESMSMQNLRPEDRYTANTSEIARMLSKSGLMIDPVSFVGGTGIKQLSPVQIDSMIRGYFSGVGVLATSTVDGLLRHSVIDRGEALPMTLKDFAGSFAETLPSNSSRYTDMLYESAKQIEESYNSYRNAIKSGDTEKAQAILASEGPEIAKYHMVEHLKKQEGKITRQIQQIRNSVTLSGEEKAARIQALRQAQDRTARSFR